MDPGFSSHYFTANLNCAESEAKVRAVASHNFTAVGQFVSCNTMWKPSYAATTCTAIILIAKQLFYFHNNYCSENKEYKFADKSQPVSQFQLKKNIFSV